MEKSNCECHLFYMCLKTRHVLDELKHIVNIIFEKEYSTC